MASNDPYRDHALRKKQHYDTQIQENELSRAKAEAELAKVKGRIQELQSRLNLEEAERDHLTRKIQNSEEDTASLQTLKENVLRFLGQGADQSSSAEHDEAIDSIVSNDEQERLPIRGTQNAKCQSDRPGGPPVPGGASRVPLTTSNESLIESEYLHIIEDSGRWLELSCKYCGANARSDLQRYLYRETGFISHVRKVHTPMTWTHKLTIHNIREHCNVRVLDPADVERIHRGERPAHAITMRFPPKDANTIQLVENGGYESASGQTLDAKSEASGEGRRTSEFDRSATQSAQTPDTSGSKRVREADTTSMPTKQRRNPSLRARPSTSFSQFFNNEETGLTDGLNQGQEGNDGSFVGHMRRKPNTDNDEYIPRRA